jgi:hypothetical protein
MNDDGGLPKLYGIRDYRNMNDEQIRSIHGQSAEEFYKTFSQSFGPEGRGVKYVYLKRNKRFWEDNKYFVFDTDWEWKESKKFTKIDHTASPMSQLLKLKKEGSKHGFYYGAGCITKYGPMYNAGYNFQVWPVDAVGYGALKHDFDYSMVTGDDYQGFLHDTRTLKADLDVMKYWQNYLSEVNSGDYIDPYSLREASEEAIQSAQLGVEFFKMVSAYKQWKIDTLESNGFDPYNPDNMQMDIVSLREYGRTSDEAKKAARFLKLVQ